MKSTYPGRMIQKTLEILKDEYLSSRSGPWVVAWSGGKDSSLLLHAVISVLLELPANRRWRKVCILTNDTLVESPFVTAYQALQIQKIERFLKGRNLPVEFKVSVPATKDTFWANVIGRGYPAPTRHFRWCTDRLKIRPTISHIKDLTNSYGHSTLLIGVRMNESSERSKIAQKYNPEERLNPHNSLKNCMVFRPIIDWTTDEVWEFLATTKPHWDDSYDALIALYRDAIGGECPIVLDPDAAPSCGSSSIRFGCWTCTVVQKDKSLRGSIENSDDRFLPLAEFRDWLKDVSADKSRRMGIRRNGQDGLGPMNFELRKEILDRLLAIQEQVKSNLISQSELHEIMRIWRVDKVMFDGYFRFREAERERNPNECVENS